MSGDVTDHGTDIEYDIAQRWLGHAQPRCLVVAGNHDHYGDLYEGDHLSPGGIMCVGNTRRFVAHIGPRWWARRLADGLLIGLDWFSWRLGLDRDEQLCWLRAVARAFPERMNVVLITHDEFCDKEWAQLCSQLKPHVVQAVLSGHWHVSRVQNIRGYIGYSTGNCSFGGLHIGPPEARVIVLSPELKVKDSVVVIGVNAGWKVEGRRDQDKAAIGSTSEQSYLWNADFPCRFHRANALVVSDEMVIGGTFGNRPGGVLIWLSVVSGTVHREVVLRHGCVGPLKQGLVAAEAVCVYSAVDGTVVAVDWLGNILWERERKDSVLSYSQQGVAAGTSVVFSGDSRGVECQRLIDGTTVWSSGPFGTPENLIAYGTPIAIGQYVVFPLGGPGVGVVCLDANTGEMVWKESAQRGIPASGILVDGGCGYLVRSTGIVECFEIGTGRLVWCEYLCSSLGGPTPIVMNDKVIAVTSDGYGGVFDKESGKLSQTFRVSAPGGRVGGYRNVSPLVTGLGSVGNSFWISCADGTIYENRPGREIEDFRILLRAETLTTSATQFVDPNTALIIGFEGHVSLRKVGMGLS